jgi:hypothetical protein
MFSQTRNSPRQVSITGGLDHGPASRLGAKRPQAEAVPFARRPYPTNMAAMSVTRPARDSA